jgi:hypothetical protein
MCVEQGYQPAGIISSVLDKYTRGPACLTDCCLAACGNDELLMHRNGKTLQTNLGVQWMRAIGDRLHIPAVFIQVERALENRMGEAMLFR